jgi:hypothetical protein
LLIMVSAGCLASVVLLALRRYRFAAAPALLAAALFVEPVVDWAMDRPARPLAPVDGAEGTWAAKQRFASAVLDRAEVASSYLPWATVPLLLGAFVAAIAWSSTSRVGWTAFASVLAAVPAAVLFWWSYVSPLGIVAREHPRWTWGYYEEWHAAGARVESGGGPCFNALRVANDAALARQLLSYVRREAIDVAVNECARVCAMQRGQWNPGVLERECALLGSRADGSR